MCGIFGFVGKQDALSIVLGGLERLEYRGYDSSGVASFSPKGELDTVKVVGKIENLKRACKQFPIHSTCMIGHTRWATHGAPTELNAHPHPSPQGRLCIVHNGIIENFDSLKSYLEKQGVSFRSETDTEVIAAILDDLLKQEDDFQIAFKKLCDLLHGAYALAIIDREQPQVLWAYAKGSPLIIGAKDRKLNQGVGGSYISSDIQALIGQVDAVMHLREGELARLGPDSCSVFDLDGNSLNLSLKPLHLQHTHVDKGPFAHFMRKEISDQIEAIRTCLKQRLDDEHATALFPEIELERRILHRFTRIQILACGSSWHAGLVAASLLEDMARIPVDVEISSEFRYKNPIIQGDTLIIAISQSGETADTLAAVEELKAKGVFVLGICNVVGSSLDMQADACVHLNCGPEISVASTKAFTSQMIVLMQIALMMARLRDLDKAHAQQFISALRALPTQIEKILEQEKLLEELAKKYCHYKDFFFVGRRYMFPLALEGALKLKEISYINANGYAAGELKHGPISLIHPDCPTVALLSNEQVFDKTLSNIMEIKARGGRVFAIAYEGGQRIDEIADDVFYHPKSLDALMPVLSAVVCQLFAYHVARYLGMDIDQPRNLAKSVTVE